MSLLTKTLYHSSGDFRVYQVNIDNGNVSLLDSEIYTSGVKHSGLVGSYTKDPLFDTAIKVEDGTYATALVVSPNLHRDSLVFVDLYADFIDVTNSGLVNGVPADDGEIRTENPNVSAIIKSFFQFQQNYDFNLYQNSDFTSDYILSDISNLSSTSYDLSERLVSLNSEPTWFNQGNIAIVFTPSGDGIRRISFDRLVINYNAIKPAIPTNVLGSGGDSFVSLTWNPPSDDGGSDISDYAIQYANITDGFTGWSTINTNSSDEFFTISNLVNDNPYIFRVAAINSIGTGDYSSASVSVYPEEPKIITSSTFNDSNYTRIRLRRDTASNWSDVNPVLALGEAGYETDTRLLKVGDNNTEWNDLGYVKVENSSIDFPAPPNIILGIGDSESFSNPSTRIECNLSAGQNLNIIGQNGINVSYSNINKFLKFSLDDTFSYFNSGTVVSPSGDGTPGSVYYDSDYLYICVGVDDWRRIEITPEDWFAFEKISVSNDQGSYPSVTSISSSGTQINVVSDGDPYPAKASSSLVNDGSTSRDLFFESYSIQDQSYDFAFRYRGGTSSSAPQYAISGINGVFVNGVVFSSPDSMNDILGSYAPPEGFHFNRTFFGVHFKIDNCGGFANYQNQYVYCNGNFLSNCWDNKVYESNDYYYSTNYNGDYYRHTDGHSKILGFCFDGYPIYGPFGYTDSEIPSNGVSLMTSSYVLKSDDSHRPTDWEFTRGISVDGVDYILSAGAFVEDFEYTEEAGILDQYNGRYAVTPEYPHGTYAYFLTFTDSSLAIPKYPYIIGNYSKQQRPI